jgi:hypothetical protein
MYRRIRLKNTGSIEIEMEPTPSGEVNSGGCYFVDEEQNNQQQQQTGSSGGGCKSVRGTNPWVLKCHQKQLSQLRRSAIIHPQQKEQIREPQTQSNKLTKNTQFKPQINQMSFHFI